MLAIQILIGVLVVLELIRLRETVKANAKIIATYRETENLKGRWNEMCQGVEGLAEQGEWLNELRVILVDKYGWPASSASELNVDAWLEYYKDGMTPGGACREGLGRD